MELWSKNILIIHILYYYIIILKVNKMGAAKKKLAGPKAGDRVLMTPTQKLAADKQGNFLHNSFNGVF